MTKPIKFDSSLVEKIKRNIPDELYNIYNRGIDEINKLDEMLGDGNIDTAKKDIIRNYYVIRLISLLETFLRNSFIIILDTYEPNFKTSITMDLKDLITLRKRRDKFTNGEIVANSLNFQQFDRNKGGGSAYGIFSELFEMDLFTEMTRRNNEMLDIDKNLVDLLNERHRIVHDFQQTLHTHEMLKVCADSIKLFIVTYADIANDVKNKWTS